MISTLFQLVGVAFLSLAGFLILPAIGFAVVGIGLVVVGNAMERR